VTGLKRLCSIDLNDGNDDAQVRIDTGDNTGLFARSRGWMISRDLEGKDFTIDIWARRTCQSLYRARRVEQEAIMNYQVDESAKWSQAVQKVTDELDTAVQTGLDKNAARGFASPTGATLSSLLKVGNKAQMALTEENGKIYAGQRELIFKVEEFDLNIAVELNKLALAWYKSDILNAIALEQAQQDAQIDEWRGDIIRLHAETDKREARNRQDQGGHRTRVERL